MLHATSLTCALASACVLLVANVALAAEDKSPTVPAFTAPVTEDFLRQLDNDQLRIVRQAARGCTGIGKAMRAERNPCVTSSVDKAVDDSKNADLQAFHRALPLADRYDETRSSLVWRSWVTSAPQQP